MASHLWGKFLFLLSWLAAFPEAGGLRSQDGGRVQSKRFCPLFFFSALATPGHKRGGQELGIPLAEPGLREKHMTLVLRAEATPPTPGTGTGLCTPGRVPVPVTGTVLTSPCPFWAQIHAEIINWLVTSCPFILSSPGLMPRLALPTGTTWSNLQNQGPLFGDKTENHPVLAF